VKSPSKVLQFKSREPVAQRSRSLIASQSHRVYSSLVMCSHHLDSLYQPSIRRCNSVRSANFWPCMNGRIRAPLQAGRLSTGPSSISSCRPYASLQPVVLGCHPPSPNVLLACRESSLCLATWVKTDPILLPTGSEALSSLLSASGASSVLVIAIPWWEQGHCGC
jgi:hypothetical protein